MAEHENVKEIIEEKIDDAKEALEPESKKGFVRKIKDGISAHKGGVIAFLGGLALGGLALGAKAVSSKLGDGGPIEVTPEMPFGDGPGDSEV
jgi:hypothetical protein